MKITSFRVLAALSLGLVFGLAHAQKTYGQDTGSYDPDPPDRAARLSYLQGDVSLQPAGEEEWADAMVNRPLTTGDKLWTDQNSRAEIYVGEAAVRLGSNTGFSFLNVDDNTIQMRMTAGVIDVNVHALDGNDQIEVDTPNIALSILRPGRYRVEVNDAGDTTVVKISEGSAEASSGSQSTAVHAQQIATFRGEGEMIAQLSTLGGPDDFDRWSLERERRDQRAASSQTARYVAPDVTGYQDLDDNGSWASEPEYGYVWTPRVAMGWSPYRDGRWVWVSPWGWTWIDDAPWGYAPFHYGRWAHVRERWCWVPGPRAVRAVYAPALVGWVGRPGVSVSVSIGGGGVGWFPLGPREVYVPGRRFSPRYVERVNVNNTVIVNRTYITNVYNNRETNVSYRNRGVPGAVTSVSRSTFTSAQRVGPHRIQMDEREVSRVGGTALAPQIAPERASRMGGDRTRVNLRMPPQTVVNRQVVVKRAPPPAATRFVRGEGTNNALRGPDRSARPQDNRPETHVERGRDVDDRGTREAYQRGTRETDERGVRESRPARNDRPPQVQTGVQSGTQPNTQEQPQVIVGRPAESPRPATADRTREDRPWRGQQQRQPQTREQPEQRQTELPQRQQREQPREAQDNARAERQQERPVETQRTEQRQQREPDRPRAERAEPKPQAEKKPEPEQKQPREDRRRPREAQQD